MKYVYIAVSLIVLFIASCFLLPKILYPELGPSKESNGFWVEKHFLDEFGDRKENWSYWTHIDTIYADHGNYNGSNYQVKVVVNVQPDVDMVYIELYKDKNGDTHVIPNNHVDKKAYTFKMKRNGIEVVFSNNELIKYDKAVGLDVESSIKLINMLKNGGEFKFLINEYSLIGNATYSFTINDEYGKGFIDRWICYGRMAGRSSDCKYWKDICRCGYKKYYWF